MRNFEQPGRSIAVGRSGMAATSHPTATITAIDILRSGGKAIDAAVAACAVQCVVEAGSTGIGGDCFALLALNGGDQVIAYNGSGRTPAAVDLEWFKDQGISEIARSSPHAVTIPGAVDAWTRLVADHGRMSMADILAPAIALAHDGYGITPRVSARYFASARHARPATRRRAAFSSTTMKFPQLGPFSVSRNSQQTLSVIGRHGRDRILPWWRRRRHDLLSSLARRPAHHRGFLIRRRGICRAHQRNLSRLDGS